MTRALGLGDLKVTNKTSDLFFIGIFLPNLDLKNRISTYIKDFSWKKKKKENPNLPDFRKQNKPPTHPHPKKKSPDFNDKFPYAILRI
jgi:hypothetical protein